MHWILRFVAVVLVVVSGCAGSSESAEDATTESTGVTSPLTTRESTATTATKAPATSTATTVPESPLSEITLGVGDPGDVGWADGLGVVGFGDPMGDVMATMTNLLGEPQGDGILESPFGDEGELGSGLEACAAALGTVCFDYLRIVRWESVGLTILFSDSTVSPPALDYYDREVLPAAPNLRGYSYWGGTVEPALFTEHGITIGSTIGDLFDAYRDRLGFSDDVCVHDTAGFYVIVDGEGLIGLRGELSAAPDSPDAAVRSIVAGLYQSNC